MAEQTYSFLDGSTFSQTGKALNQTAQTSLSNLGVSGNSYSSYVPPTTSTPAPSTALTSPNLNFASGGVPESGSSAVAGAVAGVAGTPPQSSTTPSFDMATTGDYTKDPAYQTALNNYNQSVQDFTNSANALPSQTDLLTSARQSTGAATSQAEVAKLKSELAASVAAYNNEFARTETKGIQEGVPALFYQGEIAAKQRQASVLTTGISSRLAAAQDNWQMAEQLAEKTASLQWADAQQKVDNKLKFIALNQENLTRTERVALSKMEAQARAEQRQLDTYKQNMTLALTTGVKTRFTNKNGEFFISSSGQAFSNANDFLKAAGVKSFEEAYQKGLVTDITGETLANQDLVRQAQSKYPDVSIPLNSTQAQISQIIKGSRIYQDQVRGPVGGGSSPTGLASINIIDPAIDAGVKQIISSRPGDGGWGNTYDAIAAKYGKAVADKYNGVLDNVFRQGTSVDAAFNNMKIGNNSSNANQAALDIILGSGSFTKEQKATITNAIQNGQDAFSVIKNQAKNIMGQTNATKLDNYETAKSQLSDIQSALERYYKNGGNTSLFKGNYEKVTNKLGEVNDPKLVEISTQLQSALQIYRNAVSGTAYSVQEGADIASIFPGINKSEGLNKAILAGRMSAFDSTIDSTYKNVLGSSYDQLKASNGSGGSSSGGTTLMTAPDGSQWDVPNDQINIFKQNGYK